MSGLFKGPLERYQDALTEFEAARTELSISQGDFLLSTMLDDHVNATAIERARNDLKGAYAAYDQKVINLSAAKIELQKHHSSLTAEDRGKKKPKNEKKIAEMDLKLQQPLAARNDKSIMGKLETARKERGGMGFGVGLLVFISWLFRAKTFASTLRLYTDPSVDIDQRMRELVETENPLRIRQVTAIAVSGMSEQDQNNFRAAVTAKETALRIVRASSLAIPPADHSSLASSQLVSQSASLEAKTVPSGRHSEVELKEETLYTSAPIALGAFAKRLDGLNVRLRNEFKNEGVPEKLNRVFKAVPGSEKKPATAKQILTYLQNVKQALNSDQQCSKDQLTALHAHVDKEIDYVVQHGVKAHVIEREQVTLHPVSQQFYEAAKQPTNFLGRASSEASLVDNLVGSVRDKALHTSLNEHLSKQVPNMESVVKGEFLPQKSMEV